MLDCDGWIHRRLHLHREWVILTVITLLVPMQETLGIYWHTFMNDIRIVKVDDSDKAVGPLQILVQGVTVLAIFK